MRRCDHCRGRWIWIRTGTQRGNRRDDIGVGARLDSGLSLSTCGEAHMRREVGGPEPEGVEFVCGLRAARGVVRIDARRRLLVDIIGVTEGLMRPLNLLEDPF